jgi:hypothetical protein
MIEELAFAVGQALSERGPGNVSIIKKLGDYNIPQISQLVKDLTAYFKAQKDERLVIAVAPLNVTKILTTLAPSVDKYRVPRNEYVTFYLHCEQRFFIEAEEEYRKSLTISPDLKAVFRSWRDAQSASLGWEFNNHIFVWPKRPGNA